MQDAVGDRLLQLQLLWREHNSMMRQLWWQWYGGGVRLSHLGYCGNIIWRVDGQLHMGKDQGSGCCMMLPHLVAPVHSYKFCSTHLDVRDALCVTIVVSRCRMMWGRGEYRYVGIVVFAV